jgi:hypothetical protein
VCARICVASACLATQLAAQSIARPDSLGLQTINQALNLVPVPLSMELTRGELKRVAPYIRMTSLGVQHAIFGEYRGRIGVSYGLAFAADSGSLFARAMSSKSPLVSFELMDQSDNVDSILVRSSLYQTVIALLGPPDFCERDTVLREHVSIVVKSEAAWRRGEYQVMFNSGYDLRDEPSPIQKYFARFSLVFMVNRMSDNLMVRDMPTRRDAPCFFSDDEVRQYRVSLDSVAFKVIRDRLLLRPERPFVRPPDTSGPSARDHTR